MTLIMTAMTKLDVVQASDRRLTRNGNLYDDSANKAVCVACSDARFAMAYTGIAEIQGTRTDEWLVDFLASEGAGGMKLASICEALRSRATTDLSNVPPKHRRITFALGGFRNTTPFAAAISNFEDNKGHSLNYGDSSFNINVWSWSSGTANLGKTQLMIHGREDAVRILASQIKKRIRQMFRQDGDTVARTLVSLIRAATRDPLSGSLIGRNCMSVVVPFTGGFRTTYHPDKVSPQVYAPHLISRGMVFKGIEIWKGDGPPPWWHH